MTLLTGSQAVHVVSVVAEALTVEEECVVSAAGTAGAQRVGAGEATCVALSDGAGA